MKRRRNRIDPAEEARHREAMAALGMHDAAWALAKWVLPADLLPVHNRLLFFEKAVRGGPIPKLFLELEEIGHPDNKRIPVILKLFPELEELSHPDNKRIPVTILSADGVEEVTHIRYVPYNETDRIVGPGWIRFAKETGISSGDRIDVYTCRRDDGGDGERCLFFFKS